MLTLNRSSVCNQVSLFYLVTLLLGCFTVILQMHYLKIVYTPQPLFCLLLVTLAVVIMAALDRFLSCFLLELLIVVKLLRALFWRAVLD